MTVIPEFTSKDSSPQIAAALDESGCVVVHGMNTGSQVDRVKDELAPYMSTVAVQESDNPDSFYPANTRRVPALMARSNSSHRMALNPLVADLCDEHLGPNCELYQLHVSAALEIGPGAREQILHREEDPFTFFTLPRPKMILATMWAMGDFTKVNGATLLVPGSHRWQSERKAAPDEVVSAEMPMGSMLVWLGGTLHAAGANMSNEWRYGVILTYSLGWLRQEENQYLDLPADIAETMSSELKTLVGYKMHGSLGFYDPNLRTGLA